MISSWSKPVSWLILGAYLASGWVDLAHGTSVRTSSPASQLSQAAPSLLARLDAPHSGPCTHCGGCKKARSGAKAADNASEARPCRSCPCEGGDRAPGSHSCPTGCLLCSVAKAPCIPVRAPAVEMQALLVGHFRLAASTFTSRTCGGLYRPPRA